MTLRESSAGIRACVIVLVMALLAPLSLPFAYAADLQQPPKPGMSNKQKLLLLTGAALLYFLYKKHQANQVKTVNGKQPQLYRSKNGGIYYRDVQGRPVWLTVPQEGYQVPAAEVQQYAPDYASYRGPAPAAPRGYRTQPFSNYDNGLMVPGPR